MSLEIFLVHTLAPLGSNPGSVPALYERKVLYSPSQIIGPLLHFGISQNKVIFLKLINKIHIFPFTLFKNLMPFFFYNLN